MMAIPFAMTPIDMTAPFRPPSVTAHAKINLTLNVTGRDAAGYHKLVSAVCFTDFGDKLTISASQGTTEISYSGPFADELKKAGGDSLLAQAAQVAQNTESHHIQLEKNIPLGGGLGGGSADAAAYLRFLSQTWPCDEKAALRDKSLILGADVPACFDNQCHIMTGRGELAHDIEAPQGDYPFMVITNPLCHANTAAVFGEFAASQKAFSDNSAPDCAALITAGAWHDLLHIGNDLMPAACRLYPQIATLLDEMAQAGAALGDGFIGHSMSGSGASCFALLQDADAASAYHSILTKRGIWAVMTRFF